MFRLIPAGFVTGFVSLLLLTSCGDGAKRADLVFINGAEPQTLDPALVSGQNEMRISTALFEGLMRSNAQGRAEPGLAEKVEVSDDGLLYTFHLRENLTWSDATPLTSADVLYSWQRVLNPATAADYAPILFFIKNAEAYNQGKVTDFAEVGIRAPSPNIVEVELANRTPFFLELCAFLTYAIVPRHAIESHGDLWTRPGNIVGNGPFLMDAWKIDDRIRLKKNPAYWDSNSVALNTVDVLVVPDANTAMNFFLTGEADLMMDKSQIPVNLIDKLKGQPWFHNSSILGTYFVRFNHKRPPFDNPKVRMAFALATDKALITEKITRLGEVVATSFTPAGAGGNYEPPQSRIDFHIEEARRLLAEAGYPDGKGFPTIEYLYNNKDIDRNVAVELQDMWKRHLNVEVQLRKEEWRVYLDSMTRLDYDLCRSSWVGDYDDPNTFLQIFTSNDGNNRTGWASQSYDETIAAAAAEADPINRQNILRSAEEQLVSKEVVILPLYHYVGLQFYDPTRLGGIEGNLLDMHPFSTMFRKDQQKNPTSP
jgi:oligopeptide transport system substrate-binding protein